MENTTAPTTHRPGYSASFLVDQTFTARPSKGKEGGNYVVEGPIVGVVVTVATLNPDFAAASARRFQAKWDAMTVDERHLRLHNQAGCVWCEQTGEELAQRVGRVCVNGR